MLAVGEDNRDFLYPEAALPYPVVHLDLKRIAFRMNCIKVNCLKHGPPETFKAGSSVVDWHSCNYPRVVPRREFTEKHSPQGPVDNTAILKTENVCIGSN